MNCCGSSQSDYDIINAPMMTEPKRLGSNRLSSNITSIQRNSKIS
jgi:hypothetical protein